MNRLNENFFDCDAVMLARKLLGKVLCVKTDTEIKKMIISETEAYGINDTACHCYKGRTKRNDPMFKQGGTVYVYLCYGLHEILNFVAGNGEGQAAMLRAVKHIEPQSKGKDRVIGPGCVTKTLKVDRSFNYEFLPTSKRIWIENGTAAEPKIEELKRIGISYASKEDQEKLWRFKLIDS